jgi:hypothetical protein
MKTNIKNSHTSNRSFPKLMQNTKINGFIVLMREVSSYGHLYGTVVSVGDSKRWKLGEYSENWVIDAFHDFEGTLELSND